MFQETDNADSFGDTKQDKKWIRKLQKLLVSSQVGTFCYNGE